MAKKEHKNKKSPDLESFNFEQAIASLTEIVEKIEQGEIPLQDSLEAYEKGMTLIDHCRSILQEAETRIETISKQSSPSEDEAS